MTQGRRNLGRFVSGAGLAALFAAIVVALGVNAGQPAREAGVTGIRLF